ncbi:MAG: alpha-mannosidase [Candidatus Sumerlaeaceae bacterium]
MERYPDYTRERLKQLTDKLRARIYPEVQPLTELLVSEQVDDRISYAEAQKLTAFRPAQFGDQFGPRWATFWFRAKATIPDAWKSRRVDVLWNTFSEGTLWVDGRSIQGLNYEPAGSEGPVRIDATLTRKARGGETLPFQVEMACNGLFGEWEHMWPTHYKHVSRFVLDRAEIALFDQDAWDLFNDFEVLQSLEADQSKGDLDKTWAGTLLAELNSFANIYDPMDRETWRAGSKILKALYKNSNASCVHECSAIGHAHIDTAWLWPLAETHRKCERTFSSQTTYMEDYPDYKFACSQAQQYDWIKQRNPDLYDRIRQRVKSGQWVIVGGTWIEPDCNIPSGEALVRQFLVGQRFFQQEFGVTCREFWNPDVFGYNGQLPQICRGAGITRFLTNKLSWNRFNKPHHHTFMWEGIDGSDVLTHFPPTEDYNAIVTVEQMRKGARDYKDHDRSTQSIVLYGYGDGGGGPTRLMLERLRRYEDLQGIPRTRFSNTEEFWERLEKDITDRTRQVGELYFEYHRGTYTTQAATKRGNRKTEILLHDVEFLSAIAHRLHGFSYPTQQLDHLWKLVLLNQFHDILPGSSIKLVYDDAKRHYAEIEQTAISLIKSAAAAIGGAIINTTAFDRAEVITLSNGKPAFAEAPAYGTGTITTAPDNSAVTLTTGNDGSVVLENEYLAATLQPDGTVRSLVEKYSGRESLAASGNQLLIYEDTPTAWAAWDVDPFHMEMETPCSPATSMRIVQQHELRAEVEFNRSIGRASSLRQFVRLDAASRRLEFHCEVDWHEENRMLKVAFPVNVRAMNATYEMQFGNAERPTHFNTPYDLARYEVPGHRWSDVSEHGFGVALLSESKYGYSTHGNTMRISLLRSPKNPDPEADMGKNHFSYAIVPHIGNWREGAIVQEAASFNMPLLVQEGPNTSPAESRATHTSYAAVVEDTNLVLDTIKKAEDSDALILRFYECHGARGTAIVRLNIPFRKATFCNLLEEETTPAVIDGIDISIPYTPYKIITMKVD